MSACLCGKKVERCHPKIQCFTCKAIFHASGCNIKESDLELGKNTFKCVRCTRRKSDVQPISPIISLVGKSSAGSQPLAVPPVSMGGSMDLPSDADVPPALNGTLAVPTQGPENLSLLTIYEEIVALRGENRTLRAFIVDLNEKVHLLSSAQSSSPTSVQLLVQYTYMNPL